MTQQRGCVAGIGGLLTFLIVLVVGAGIAWMVFGSFKSSNAYQIALQRAQESAEVQEALGTPIEADWWVTGEMNQNGSMENAQIQIPIHGPRAGATLYVDGRGVGNEMTFFILSVEVNGTGQIIDLRDE